MKTIILSFCISVLTTCLFAEDNGVYPILPVKFGEVVSLEIEFVEKPNDYFSQNCIDEPFRAKVLNVGGKDLKEPIYMNYRCGNEIFQKGKRYKFIGYEDINSFGDPRGWGDVTSQFNYSIRHLLMLKHPPKEGKRTDG